MSLLNPTSYVVQPEWLLAHLSDGNLRLIDARPPADFARAHLPGAVGLDLMPLQTRDTSPTGVKTFRTMLGRALSEAGVSYDQTVVFYDERSGSRAARGVWLLEYFGHEAVHLLDGGFDLWAKLGYPTTQEVYRPPATRFKVDPPTAEGTANYEYVRDRLKDPETQIVDVRRPAEYYAQSVQATRGGAIPGALHLEWVANLDEEGRFKKPEELAKLYSELGLERDKEIITYCQAGYRAANTYLALRMAGFTRVRNYFGSWGEWGDRLELPIEVPQEPGPVDPSPV